MANPNFVPTFSSDEIWRGQDTNRCISDDLDTIEADIDKLQSDVGNLGGDYAPANHRHDEYATVASLAEVKSELNGKADSNHNHDTAYAKSEHVHASAEITDFPNAMKNPSSLTIQSGGASIVYDGSKEKQINITPDSIGAAAKNHTHDSFNSVNIVDGSVDNLSVETDFLCNGKARFKAYPTDKYNQDITNGAVVYTTAGIDPNTTLDEAILTHHKNGPVSGQYYYIKTMFYNGKSASVNRAQYAIPYSNNGSMYHRYRFNDKWSAWRRHANADELGKVAEVVQMLAAKCDLSTEEAAMVSSFVDEFSLAE